MAGAAGGAHRRSAGDELEVQWSFSGEEGARLRPGGSAPLRQHGEQSSLTTATQILSGIREKPCDLRVKSSSTATLITAIFCLLAELSDGLPRLLRLLSFCCMRINRNSLDVLTVAVSFAVLYIIVGSISSVVCSYLRTAGGPLMFNIRVSFLSIAVSIVIESTYWFVRSLYSFYHVVFTNFATLLFTPFLTPPSPSTDSEYDTLDHARPTNDPKPNYTKMDGTLRKSKSKISDSDEDNESTGGS